MQNLLCSSMMLPSDVPSTNSPREKAELGYRGQKKAMEALLVSRTDCPSKKKTNASDPSHVQSKALANTVWRYASSGCSSSLRLSLFTFYSFFYLSFFSCSVWVGKTLGPAPFFEWVKEGNVSVGRRHGGAVHSALLISSITSLGSWKGRAGQLNHR